MGSVILLVSPLMATVASATKAALATCAMAASLSFTTCSADTPASACAAGELPDDESSPHPAVATSATTRSSAAHRTPDLRRMTGSLSG